METQPPPRPALLRDLHCCHHILSLALQPISAPSRQPLGLRRSRHPCHPQGLCRRRRPRRGFHRSRHHFQAGSGQGCLRHPAPHFPPPPPSRRPAFHPPPSPPARDQAEVTQTAVGSRPFPRRRHPLQARERPAQTAPRTLCAGSCVIPQPPPTGPPPVAPLPSPTAPPLLPPPPMHQRGLRPRRFGREPEVRPPADSDGACGAPPASSCRAEPDPPESTPREFIRGRGDEVKPSSYNDKGSGSGYQHNLGTL